MLLLIIVIINQNNLNLECFSNNNNCPDILIQKDKHIYLYNSKLAKIPGINPIQFNNLEEYIDFTNWQRSQNINCPILVLKHSYNSKGDSVYKKSNKHNSITDFLSNDLLNNMKQPITKLFDATRNDSPYNDNSMPGYDSYDQYIGLYTPLDQITDTTKKISPNPMDSNWGGGDYTQGLIDKGYYKDNEIYIRHT